MGQKVYTQKIDSIEWSFFHPKKIQWMDLGSYGSVQEAFIENGEMPDPFYGTNENKFSWFEEQPWEFKTIITIEEEQLNYEFNELYFGSVDTYGSVFVNGTKVLVCENAFIPHSVQIKPYLKVGVNEITVVITPPVLYHAEMWKNKSYQLPAPNDVHDVAIAPYTRKPQYQFGWDWALRLNTIGFNKPAALHSYNENRIINKSVKILAISESEATIEFMLEMAVDRPANYSWQGEGLQNEMVALNNGQMTRVIKVKNPKLWWPRGHGEQNIYDQNILLYTINNQVIDSCKLKYGIKTSELIQEKDEWGTSYYFKINGRRIFSKGGDYIPQDIFPARVTDQAIVRLVEDMAESNFNMIRVWGGGYYPDDIFYETCDRLGLMVWQDFMFACAMYPGNEDFLQSVEQEATQQIKRLRKHPSIALWCGNNEIAEGWHRWGWKDQRTEKEKEAIWADYQTLFNKLLPNLVRSLTTSAYWESSPQFGRGNSKHQFNGDAHYWGVWHDAEPFENFQTKVPRFMSEYGFQSFPEMEALDLFALEEDLYLESEVINTHQKHPRGNTLIAEYLNRDFKTPVDFESFVYLSQIVQAEGIQMGIEAHRSARPYNMGTLYWQFNDCWPAVSWSSRDYYGNWKALHYTVKKAYEDLLVTTRQTKDSVFVYLVNDANQSMDFDLLIEHIDYTGATLGAKAKYVSSKKASSTLVYTAALEDFLYIDGLKNQSYLEVQVVQDGVVMARKLHHFAKTKDLKLPYAGISFKVEKDSLGFVVELFSDGFVKNLKLSCLHDGRFEDNYFDLPANEHKRIRFYNTYPLEVFNDTYLTFFSVVDTYE